MTDVFISFNSSDRERARSIADFLKGKKLSVFVDESYLVPGRNWVEGLESALGSCRSVAVLLGPGGMGKWQKAEVQLALDRHQTQPGFPVVPVLLPGNDDPPTGFLALNTWIDLRKPVTDDRSLANLHAALLGLPPAEADFNPRAEVCPYRGLLPFREEDRNFFFGRETEVADLVSRIRDSRHPVVGITGRSGSGKSSLVYAGLIPELRAPSAGAPWEIIVFRPREKPLDELIAAFSPPPEGADLVTRRAHLNERVELLRHGRIRLSELVTDVLHANTGSERLLIFVDQWEELYSQARQTNDPAQKKEIEADRHLFINTLLETPKDSECTLVFTVRADFYDQVLTHSDLTRHINEHGLSVGPISDEGLRDCIVKPAIAAGYRFADGLVDRIASDAKAEPGRLPLLEYLLQELWKNRDRDEFTHNGYEKAGGVAGAIAKRAESEFLKLEKKGDPELIRATRRLFVSLVAPGEGREDTRAYIAPPDSEPERFVVEHFSSAKVRLITASKDRIEVSHEALIQQWTRLREDWLAQNREILRVRDRVREVMKTYDAEGKPRSRLLPPGKPLEEAKDLLKNHGDVMIDDVEDFVRRSAEKERNRKIAIFAAVLLVVFALSGLTVWALGERHNAKEQAARADERARAAEIEEGKAWMERANYYKSQPPGGEFYTAMMAARAIGFEEFGAPPETDGFPYKVLFRSGTADYESALREAAAFSRYPKPIWSSPLTGHHEGSVSSVAFSPDGRTLASGSDDKTIKLWDLESGTLNKTLSGHSSSVYSVAFSPDGRTLASGSRDNTIKLWDLESGTLTKTLSGHSSSVNSVAFSPDGRTLASGSEDKTIKLWDLESGTLTKTLSGHSSYVYSVAFSPDGGTLASGSWDKSIKLWDLESGTLTKTLSGHSSYVLSVAFSPDGRTLASGSDDNTIKLWDLESGTLKKTLSGHSGYVRSVAFSPDRRTLASGGWDKSIKLWDLESGTLTKILFGHSNWVTSVAFSPDGRTLASGSYDKSIKLWDLESGTLKKTLSGHSNWVTSVAFSPDGRTLASGSEDTNIKLWDLESGTLKKTLSGHSASVLSVAFSPDGRTLASGSSDNTIKLWDLESGTLKKTLSGHSSSVLSVAFSPDGRTLASGSYDNTIKLWDLESGTLKKTLSGHSSTVYSVAFSPNGRTLASGSRDNTIKLWDLKSILNAPVTDLASYLTVTGGWLEMNGREITWTTTTNNLYRERKVGFLNVREDCHIAMIQRGAAASELLWQYSWARNWNGVLAMLPEITDPEVRKKAVTTLIRWLRLNAENEAITPGVAGFRLRQLTQILLESDRNSEAVAEMKKAVEAYQQQAKKEPEPK